MTVILEDATKELVDNVYDYVADLIATTVVEKDNNKYDIKMMPDMFLLAENNISSTLTITMWDSDSDLALIRVNYFDFKDITII